MELYQEILANILQKENMRITFPNLQINAKEIVEMECYRALREIKTIIENDRYSDSECFIEIEKIVSLLEQMGSGGGNRHDF